MKKISWVFWTFLVVLSAIWLMADSLWPAQMEYFAFRKVWVQFTGTLAFGAMSLAMLLATRPAWLEKHLDGLDKMYRLHKWLGITALITGTAHWLLAQGTKWAVGWGWLVRPPKGPGEGGMQQGPLELALREWRSLAEDTGEWAFYAAAVLIALALIKRFPYRLFVQTHIILAGLYLVLVGHALVLVEFAYWSQPVGWVLAIMMLTGAVSAVLVLLGKVGANRTAYGVIESLQTYPALKTLEIQLRMTEGGWHGHKPGQFAFATSNPREGAHPYTIASAWNPEARNLTFITKALGDHTCTLPERLRVGGIVKVEGPYGCFTFEDGRPHQIWIGAGIGITPFIARMKYLAQENLQNQHSIDLFHATAEYDPEAIDKLAADAKAAGVRLHLFIDKRDGHLTGERLRAMVPSWKESSVWFCGPVGFANALRTDLVAQGLSPKEFHQELFEMR